MKNKKDRPVQRTFVKQNQKSGVSSYWDYVDRSKADPKRDDTQANIRANPDYNEEEGLGQVYKDQQEIAERKEELRNVLKIQIVQDFRIP